MVEVLTSNVLVIQVQVQEVDVVHSHDIICPCDRENEDGESEDTTGIEHEGQAMGVNPLFWNVEANRGMTDEDVGLVYREERLGWRLWEIGLTTELEALSQVHGSQDTMRELVGAESEGRDDVQVPRIEWDSFIAQQNQEVELGLKSHESLNPEVSLNQGFDVTRVVSNHQIEAHQNSPAVESVLSKGLSRKVRSINELVIDTLSAKQRCRLFKVQGKGKQGRPRKDGG
ncbi:hypothetical protein V6N13_117017 [Hibiscus sabdariffa]